MADVNNEYAKDKQLRKEDVTALQEWSEKQPHLPHLSEFQTILFLQSCYFSIESAKVTIDNFYTAKTHCPELFLNRDPLSEPVQQAMSIHLYEPLPKQTPEGYKIIVATMLDSDTSKFVFSEQLKLFDMNAMLWLAQEGTAQGLLILVDFNGVTLGHVARLGIMNMKKFFYYLQEAMPVRLKGMHFVNVVPFMDKILALIKPFMKKELLDTLHLHPDGMDSLYKFIPKECLPSDYGGPLKSAKEFQDVFALRDMHIRVPEAVRVGDTVTLACDYDLEQVALYTIKWYRDDVEFYRYVPKESPPSREFIVEHLNVDVSRSNSREVTLTNVERETSGEFKCEVSADAPLFHTEIRAAHLLVADIPDDGPILTTQSQKVAPGAKIKANCTSPPAHPPVNITWFVNDVEVEKKFGIHIQRALARYNNAIPQLETVHSIIAITAVPDIFKSGKLKLRCLATMFTLYRRTEELEVQEDAPLLALIMIPTTPSSQGTCNGIYDATKYLIYTMAAIMLLKSMNLIKS